MKTCCNVPRWACGDTYRAVVNCSILPRGWCFPFVVVGLGSDLGRFLLTHCRLGVLSVPSKQLPHQQQFRQDRMLPSLLTWLPWLAFVPPKISWRSPSCVVYMYCSIDEIFYGLYTKYSGFSRPQSSVFLNPITCFLWPHHVFPWPHITWFFPRPDLKPVCYVLNTQKRLWYVATTPSIWQLRHWRMIELFKLFTPTPDVNFIDEYNLLLSYRGCLI